jgi:hypothetical protein
MRAHALKHALMCVLWHEHGRAVCRAEESDGQRRDRHDRARDTGPVLMWAIRAFLAVMMIWTWMRVIPPYIRSAALAGTSGILLRLHHLLASLHIARSLYLAAAIPPTHVHVSAASQREDDQPIDEQHAIDAQPRGRGGREGGGGREGLGGVRARADDCRADSEREVVIGRDVMPTVGMRVVLREEARALWKDSGN